MDDKLKEQLEQLKRLNDKIHDLQSTANQLLVKLNQKYGAAYIYFEYEKIDTKPEVK